MTSRPFDLSGTVNGDPPNVVYPGGHVPDTVGHMPNEPHMRHTYNRPRDRARVRVVGSIDAEPTRPLIAGHDDRPNEVAAWPVNVPPSLGTVAGMAAGDVLQPLPLPVVACHYCRIPLRWSTALERYAPIALSGTMRCYGRSWPYRRHDPEAPEPMAGHDVAFVIVIVLGLALVAVAGAIVFVTR